jgi:hypothetical protein
MNKESENELLVYLRTLKGKDLADEVKFILEGLRLLLTETIEPKTESGNRWN